MIHFFKMPDDRLPQVARHPEDVAAYRAHRGEPPETGPRRGQPLPLDLIFGYPANVRMLRVLCTDFHPRWPAELTRRSGLSRSGAWLALVRLHELQLVKPIYHWAHGTGVPFRLDRDHPIALEIESLFYAEWRARRAREAWWVALAEGRSPP